MNILREETILGHTIMCENEENPKFTLNISKGGIYLVDGVSEIPVEIGECGQRRNEKFIAECENLTDREVELIYEIALYQYKEFQRVSKEI